MALAQRLSNVAANAAADAIARLLDNGYLKIYDGTQPATADTAITTQNLLSTLRFNTTSAPAASAGVLTFNAITTDAAIAATGTASWCRALKSDGTTVVMDGSVGTSGANLNLNSVALQILAQLSVSSFTYTQQKS